MTRCQTGKSNGKERGVDKLIQELQKTVEIVTEELKKNTEWIERYAGYASEIQNTQDSIKNVRSCFYERGPLYVYSSISKAKNANNNFVIFDLRYRGQSVATIKFHKNSLELITDKKVDKYYGIKGGESFEWNSKKAEVFRGYFKKFPSRNDEEGKNEEHRFESALLTELSKKIGSEKILKNIQPVRLVKSRFQMPTPFRASRQGRLAYAGHNGGGIDLLCRTTHGNKKTLNIFELKDEYENPAHVLNQAVVYSAFIHRLLRTPEARSNDWWKLFGFKSVPDPSRPLVINAVVALPQDKKNDTSFKDIKIDIDGGKLQLHYFYFSLSETDQIESINTSLFKSGNP